MDQLIAVLRRPHPYTNNYKQLRNFGRGRKNVQKGRAPNWFGYPVSNSQPEYKHTR